MSEINFLPESYIREQKRTGRIYTEAIIVSVIAMAFLGSFIIQHNHVSKKHDQAWNLQQKLATAIEQKHELQRLMGEHVQLSNQVKIQRELASPIAYYQVIAVLGDVMPENIALTDLEMNSVAPSVGGVKSKPGVQSDKLHINMTGLAPGDEEVAEFIGLLSDHVMFTNIKMHYSQAKQFKEFEAHEFRIETDVPLNCDYQPKRDKKIAGVTFEN